MIFVVFWDFPRACLWHHMSRWLTSGCFSRWRCHSWKWFFTPPMRYLSDLTLDWRDKSEWWGSSLSTSWRKKRYLKQAPALALPWWDCQATFCCRSAPSSSQSPSGLSASSSLTPLATLKMSTCLTALFLISAKLPFCKFCLSRILLDFHMLMCQCVSHRRDISPHFKNLMVKAM